VCPVPREGKQAGWRRSYYSKLLSLEGDEFERFQHACREPLPSTFRLAGPFRFEIGEAIQKQFLNGMAEPFSVTIEGAETITVPPAQRLTWYPEQLAWQLTAGKRALRKGTELQPLREFLIVHTASGHITRSALRHASPPTPGRMPGRCRQEAVSMIPPCFLDVHADHFVLDLCAAPGSKTSQLLEAVLRVCAPYWLLRAPLGLCTHKCKGVCRRTTHRDGRA
jgi:hypothetical protein